MYTEESPSEDIALRQLSASQEETSHQNQITGTLILDFSPLELWENKFLLFKPSSLAAWAD